MSKYGVLVPIVGYSYVEVIADNEDDAKSKAFELCCDFDNANVELQELYGVERVADGNCVNHPFWNKAIQRAKFVVKEVAEEYNNGWIPCRERLPEEYGEYLIWWTDATGKQYYEITEYEPDNGWIGDIPQAVEGIYNVIAWQPLPEPYQSKGE